MTAEEADVLEQLVVPTSLPVAGITPMMCCLCGKRLFPVRYTFLEGSVCNTCFKSLSSQAKICYRICEMKNGSE